VHWNLNREESALSVEGEGDFGSALTNVQYMPIWNCHNEFPSAQWIYSSKNEKQTKTEEINRADNKKHPYVLELNFEFCSGVLEYMPSIFFNVRICQP
jgi:hypothetical protein